MPGISEKRNTGDQGDGGGGWAKLPVDSAWHDVGSQLRLWVVAGLGLIGDLGSKSWATGFLGRPEDGKRLSVLEDYVNLSMVHNPGAIAGTASGKTALLLGVSALAVVLLLWFFASSRSSQRGCHVGLGMVIGGALGNSYDRLFNDGCVVDFIEVNLHVWPADPWPTFNLADVLLCLGVGLLVLGVWGAGRGQKTPG